MCVEREEKTDPIHQMFFFSPVARLREGSPGVCQEGDSPREAVEGGEDDKHKVLMTKK